VPYLDLHKLYRACDVYVTPSYAETFAHPLVEAMACGVPIVASELGAHREVAGDAAVYFPCFSEEALAARVREVADSAKLSQTLSRNGLQRSVEFSWEKHVEKLVRLARGLMPK
jgi:glycosyltransferase involved in cell wall biosynthesis